MDVFAAEVGAHLGVVAVRAPGGVELDRWVPVFMYEFAATRPERRSLVAIRQGEYEALPEKLGHADFAPDYGPAKFVPEFGAMVIGARKFLVAYNVNLNVTDKRWANRVAFDVREKGRTVTDVDGTARPEW